MATEAVVRKAEEETRETATTEECGFLSASIAPHQSMHCLVLERVTPQFFFRRFILLRVAFTLSYKPLINLA